MAHKSLLGYEEIQRKDYLPIERLHAAGYIENVKGVFDRLSKIYPEILLWSIDRRLWRSRGEKLIVLQLRPTPQDKPVSKAGDTKNAVCYTNFSWGDHETPALEPGNVLDMKYQGTFVQKDARSETIDPGIVDRLTSGKKLLLIDSFRGDLSHEKWALPPRYLRKKLFFHIPNRVLLPLKSKLKIIPSDKKGYIVPVEE